MLLERGLHLRVVDALAAQVGDLVRECSPPSTRLRTAMVNSDTSECRSARSCSTRERRRSQFVLMAPVAFSACVCSMSNKNASSALSSLLSSRLSVMMSYCSISGRWRPEVRGGRWGLGMTVKDWRRVVVTVLIYTVQYHTPFSRRKPACASDRLTSYIHLERVHAGSTERNTEVTGLSCSCGQTIWGSQII